MRVAETLVQNRLRQLFDKYELLQRQNEKSAAKVRERVKELGFKSTQELAVAKVSCTFLDAFPVFFVPLEVLRNYQRGDDPRPLLGKANGVICPIVVLEGGKPQVRSSASIVIDQDVKLTQLGAGAPLPIQLLTKARANLLKEREASSCRCFVIFTGLDRGFLGDETSGTFMIKVLVDDLGKLRKDDLLLAKQVFDELSNEAKDKKYDVPDSP